jgi:hypothetical protein
MPRVPTPALALTTASLILSAGACDGGTGPESPGSLSFSVVASADGGTAAPAGPRRVHVQDDGTHTLELTRVAVVIRKIELERADGLESMAVSSSEREAHDDCEELEFGPLLVEIPLDGEVDRVFSVTLPQGRYDEVEMEIHKPSHDDDFDAAFVQEHPDFVGVSIRVEGTFDGEPFVFTQDLDAEQEYDLVPPLEVGPDTPATNLTLRIDLTTWFTRADGSLVDPATAGRGGAAYEVVKDNIKRSFHAFEDDDRDGEDDDDD